MRSLAILHEGPKNNLEQQVLARLLAALHLDGERCEFYAMGSKSNFFKLDDQNYRRLADMVNNEFIEKILLVADADADKNDAAYGGYAKTASALQNMIDQLAWRDICDIYIVCDPATQTGYLESLLLATLPPAQQQCINNFLSCSEFHDKDHHKAIYKSIYELAYPQSPWNFEHQYFDGLKAKLRALFVK